ncbi:DUF502 domain-containing protein [bacterium]|nr:DUF502 domain-containing protein [bacterium]
MKFGRIRNMFFTGLIVVTPISLSLYILYVLFRMLDNILKNPLSVFLGRILDLEHPVTPFPGIGLVALTLLILAAGAIARNYFGRKMLAVGDHVVGHIPLMNRIYQTIREISEAVFSEKSELFKRAVLVEYPRKGLFTIGFFTADIRGIIDRTLKTDVVSVFIPTVPNPTTGFLIFVPKSDVINLDMSVEDAFKLVLSGGAVKVDEKKEPVQIKWLRRKNNRK